MTDHEKKLEILRKYYQDIKVSYHPFLLADQISRKQLDNAISRFAQGVDRSTILGLYDISFSENGKNGFLFTETKVYYLEPFEKPKKIWYEDIAKVEIMNQFKDKDCDKWLGFDFRDGGTEMWTGPDMNKTPMLHFFEEMMDYIRVQDEERLQEKKIEFQAQSDTVGVLGGFGIASPQIVNKLSGEEKFHAIQGHGFAAERANHLYDKLTGHDAKLVGDSNIRNGADRIVDGMQIQSKYCATGSRCINECFSDGGAGNFRYYGLDGKPMVIEVPSDKYDAAVSAMEEKIKRGQVRGVTDPKEAKDLVKKGHFTYEQAKNIAKAGTIESLTYDAVHGVVIASSAFGISTILAFAVSIWGGEELNVALKNAAASGIKVGGTTFVSCVLVSQLSKAGLNSALVAPSEAVVKVLGPKASNILASISTQGKNIYGAAAIKSASKLLRSNAITAGVTIAVMSSIDMIDIFRGRISGAQLFKNIANTTSSVAGGTAGYLGGAAIGTAVLPGIGTIVGGLIGAIGAGMAANKATSSVLDSFIEDDADEMVRIIEKQYCRLATDYLLNQKEAEKVADALKDLLDGSTLKEMYSCSDREEFAVNLLTPIIEDEVALRRVIHMPTNEQMTWGVRNVLEEISDQVALA